MSAYLIINYTINVLKSECHFFCYNFHGIEPVCKLVDSFNFNNKLKLMFAAWNELIKVFLNGPNMAPFLFIYVLFSRQYNIDYK